MDSAVYMENHEAVGLSFRVIFRYVPIDKHFCTKVSRAAISYSVFEERKAGSGGWAVASFDTSSFGRAKSEVKEKITVTLRWCFPEWEA